MKTLLVLSILLLQVTTICSIPQHPYVAQFEQDKYVHTKFFPNKRNGVFFDIGAADGVFFSNSYFFEKYLGWTGVCVEPVPSVFKLLRSARKCICINGCIWDKAIMADFMKITFPDGSGNGYSGLVPTYDPRQMKIVEDEYVKKANCKIEYIKVPCYVFNDVCKKNNIFHIDYLSMDTEGSELDILKSINFDLIDIDVIDVENNHSETNIRDFLKTKGFTFIERIGVDDFFRNNKYLKN